MKKSILVSALILFGALAYGQERQEPQPLDTVTVHMNNITFLMDWQGLNDLLETFDYMEKEEIFDPKTGLTHYDIKKVEREENWEPCKRID